MSACEGHGDLVLTISVIPSVSISLGEASGKK